MLYALNSPVYRQFLSVKSQTKDGKKDDKKKEDKKGQDRGMSHPSSTGC